MAKRVRLVLDACVLFPTVLREVLLGVAAAGLYQPVWSDRILEEWVRATAKLGPGAMEQARADAVRARDAFPRACFAAAPGIEARLLLPDADDVHVLATAIASSADAIVTFNAADFPRHVLAAEGIARRDPDGLLWEIWSHHPETVSAVVQQVHAKAERIAGTGVSQRALLKRAGLSRLGKAIHTSQP